MQAVATVITEQLVQDAANEAGIQARTAAKAFHAQHGDRDACGFAWVNVYGVRSNSSWASGWQPQASAKTTRVHCACGTPAAFLHNRSASWKLALKLTQRC